MSENQSEGKTNKTSKSMARLNIFGSPKNAKSGILPLVPPVLKEVGKLAASVASVSTNISSGSATGNPRNKVALQPGHSLMDWIRLGTSGKDLTGLGVRAGTLSVSKQELAKHTKKDDAWLAIRGKVYNVTEYFSFHPGGEDELMKGLGIDATRLFDQVHAWVNYEQILQKCLVGKLVNIDTNIDQETLFFGEKRPTKSTASVNRPNSVLAAAPQLEELSLPRFDWIQKLDYITIFFYTKAFSNPLVEVNYPVDEQTVLISLTYQDIIFKNELVFYDKIRWPCDINLTIETGKVELVFKKSSSAIWDNYGVLRQQSNELASNPNKAEYVLKKKIQVNYNTWLMKFERADGRKIIIPIGKHLRVFANINKDEEISRSYTPVPESLFEKFQPHSIVKKHVCLMVKKYPEGNLSRFITDKILEEKVLFSKPMGSFELKLLEKRETFLMLAAGTGITPMLSLILFLLERRVKKCQFIRLLFFNKSEKDILVRAQLENLSQLDKRFKTNNILSEAGDSWQGLRGHVTRDLIENSLQEHLKDTGYTVKDIYCFICGPPKFNEAARQELQKASIRNDQIHVFDG